MKVDLTEFEPELNDNRDDDFWLNKTQNKVCHINEDESDDNKLNLVENVNLVISRTISPEKSNIECIDKDKAKSRLSLELKDESKGILNVLILRKDFDILGKNSVNEFHLVYASLISTFNTINDPNFTNAFQLQEGYHSFKVNALRILETIVLCDESTLFKAPFNPYILGYEKYFDFITTPMDYKTIEIRIKNNFYKDCDQFIKDFLLIYKNHITFFTYFAKHSIGKKQEISKSIELAKSLAMKMRDLAFECGFITY
jgi:hypothetical protein